MNGTERSTERYPPIESYGAIGDLRTIALVGPSASIDFLSLPELDAPSVFAAHVDRDDGGCFYVRPELRDRRELKLYLPDTNILLSRFLSEDGIAEVSDFMLLDNGGEHQALVRIVRAIKGRIRFEARCALRFDYARTPHRLHRIEGGVEAYPVDGDTPALRLRADVPVEIEDQDVVARFELDCGAETTFVLEPTTAPVDAGGPAQFGERAHAATEAWWRTWIGKCRYDGRWREMVHRSALALKLLTSRAHGSMVAAPCFGFPNEPGGERNWDYRYTWLRDAAFTTYAFIRLGYTEEARDFVAWLEERIAELDGDARLQVMYHADGRAVSGEVHLDHLEGYERSRPVRIGSTNHDQRQLDIYGELMDAVYLYDKYGSPISHDLWRGLGRLIEHVCEHWRQPDPGIWEVRGGVRSFLISRVMCWVAVDRGVRLAIKRSRPAPLERWQKVRDEIYESIFRELWDDDKQAFVQFTGTTALDASALLMPLVRFISPTDPRWLSTLEAIRRELSEDSLVYRYRVGEAFSDQLEGREGTFSICSFWLIENLSRAGRLREARYLFEKMLSYANPLGLFSEQLGARGQALGNIPQAFTHLALISTAFDLDRRLDASHDRGLSGGHG